MNDMSYTNAVLMRNIRWLLGSMSHAEMHAWLKSCHAWCDADTATVRQFWFCLCRCVDGVLGFLAEALASLGRRPQFYWGLMQSLLPAQNSAAASGRA